MFPGLTNLKSPGAPRTNNANGPAKGMLPGIGGDNTQVGNIATQDLGGNSLTQMMRSLQNYGATQGQQTFEHGQDITNTGIQGFGTAADSTNEGMGSTRTAMGTTGAALNTLSPAEDYWTKLLSGDQHTMNMALSPVATQSGKNWANASSGAAMNAPRGGYAGVLSAGMPQAMTREVNEAAYKLQPQAATNLNTIAGTKNAIASTQNNIAGNQGNIGGVQGQIANWLSSIGIDVSKLGAGFLQMASDSLLGGRGQDVQEHGQEMQMATTLANTAMQGVDHYLGSH